MSDHECSYWRTLTGALVCACGKSKRPNDAAPAAEEIPE